MYCMNIKAEGGRRVDVEVGCEVFSPSFSYWTIGSQDTIWRIYGPIVSKYNTTLYVIVAASPEHHRNIFRSQDRSDFNFMYDSRRNNALAPSPPTTLIFIPSQQYSGDTLWQATHPIGIKILERERFFESR